MKIKLGAQVAATALSIIFLTSCATQGDIESLREDIAALTRTANEALENANQARNLNAESRTEMDLIRRELADARKNAELNREKLDSVFEKSMLK